MKHLSSTLVLICTTLTAAFPLIAESLRDVAIEADKAINELPEGFLREEAFNEFRRIYHSDKPVDEKIELLRSTFLSTPAPREQSQPKETVPTFDYSKLIYHPPLQWQIHSIEIAYDINSKTQILLSTETVRQEEDNKKRDDSSGLSNANTQNKSKNNQIGIYADLEVHTPSSSAVDVPKSMLGKVLDWFQAKLGFKWVNDHQSSTQESTSKTSQWDESAQRAWRNLYEEKSQLFQSTELKNRHLTFSISFKNNTYSNMFFKPDDVRIPVWAGPKHIGDATLVNPPSVIWIYANANAVQKFRAELETTDSLSLIDYMRNNAPGISLESGQILISSADGTITNAVQESIQDTVPFRYRDLGLEIQIVKYNKELGKTTTVGDAMMALNSIFEKKPFGLSDGKCISLAGFDLKAPSKDSDLHQLPVIVVNGIPTSDVIPANKLNQTISEDGLSIVIADLMDDDDVWKNASDVIQNHYLTYMKKVAESGDAEAAFRIGRLYAYGIGVKQNIVDAIEWYKKAADQGNAMAQYQLGCFYCSGYGGLQSYEEAVKWYTKAAEQGLSHAQCALAECLYYGFGTDKNESKAVEWYQKAADQDIAHAQDKLASFYEKGIAGVPMDTKKAFDLYQKAAKQGNAHAQNKLGDYYYFTEKNRSEAIVWYQKAAEQKNADAQYSLGCICDSEHRYNDAFQWYTLAANQGHSDAQCALGDYYSRYEAIDWALICYKAAADQSNPSALTKLGLMCRNGYYYNNGYNYFQNDSEAAKFFYQAAELGYPEAQYQLGSLYYKYGYREEAWDNISAAAKQGHEEAQRFKTAWENSAR